MVRLVVGGPEFAHTAGHHLLEHPVHLGAGQHSHQPRQDRLRDPGHGGSRFRGLLHVGQGMAHLALVHGVLEPVQPSGVDAAVDIHGGVVHRELVRDVGGAGELLHGVQGYGSAQAVAQDVSRPGGVQDGADVFYLGGHRVICRLFGGAAAAPPVINVHGPALAQALCQRSRKRPVDQGSEERSADQHHPAFSVRVPGAVTVQSQPAAVVR
jgi:hypothetical protein